ncbi:hypothetical protein DERF_004055 [Dermatophagoides farinae]|uniref:Uncharacterized protein n=1 Tax=Dermatophagoides farinae TaxID=6954 RepID=A0A922IFZ9_DERFA|nr:hypothetical protein DERF_004055 [Dermatophagoides farinae]
MRRNKHAHLFPTQCSVIRPLMKTHGSGNGTYRLMNKASIEVANNNKLSEMEKEFQKKQIEAAAVLRSLWSYIYGLNYGRWRVWPPIYIPMIVQS